MRLFAIRSADPYTRISNASLRDARLSFKARGLLAYLLSHANGFDLSAAALLAVTTDGRDAINAGIHELERLGYLARVQVRGVAGRLGSTHYAVADDPALLNAQDVADQIGGMLVASDAHKRHADRVALTDNPQNNPKKRGKNADNPETVKLPLTDNPQTVRAHSSQPKKRGKNAGNPQNTTNKVDHPPVTGFPFTANPTPKEEQGTEEEQKNIIQRAGHEPRSAAKPDEVQPHGRTPSKGEKAPTRSPVAFDDLADTIRPDSAEALNSGAESKWTPKRIADPNDPSLPKTKNRPSLEAVARMDMSEFIAAWNRSIGASSPWSATNTDLALHVLAHWTAGELREVLDTMARNRRGIGSPLRYFGAALEKLAARSARVAPRTAPAPLASSPPAPVKGSRDPFVGMSPADRARAEADMAAMLRAKGLTENEQ